MPHVCQEIKVHCHIEKSYAEPTCSFISLGHVLFIIPHATYVPIKVSSAPLGSNINVYFIVMGPTGASATTKKLCSISHQNQLFPNALAS